MTMRMKNLMVVVLLTSGVALGSSASVSASPIYFENFDSAAFVGSNLGLSGAELTSDRWASTTYYTINNTNGWTFTGGAYLARQTGTADGALLLNENDGVGTTIYNLTAGQPYSLSMLLSGDNRPGQNYVFNVNIGGTLFTVNGTDLAAGANPGTLLTYNFIAASNSVTLVLSETSGTEASPIVDNVTVTAVPIPEPGTLLLLGTGLAAVAARRRFTRRT